MIKPSQATTTQTDRPQAGKEPHMKQYKQKDLKALVSSGAAIDITTADEDLIPKHFDRIGYSHGVNGMNGGLIQDRDSGLLYAVTARSSNLFRIM